MNRIEKLKKNTYSSVICQFVTIICGFILPRLILQSYGSKVNGVLNSITQFLQFITFMEMGVGSVVESALYKPLADCKREEVNAIITSAEHFFRILAKIMLLYVIILGGIYPILVKTEFDFPYIVSLIVIMCIATFSQYYFGIVDRLLLTADQKGYIHYNIQSLSMILNTIVCFALITVDVSIHVVKLTSSLIFIIRPVVLRMYVNTHYSINRLHRNFEEPLKQKWNGIAQHIATVVLDNTDVVVLTIFGTLQEVSIYSVYHLVISGVNMVSLSLTGGIRALLGELWARQEKDTLRDYFDWFEWILHTGITFMFSCTIVLIMPFVSIYTYGVNDISYIRPVFANILVWANMMYCLRVPYSTMILAGGHYKQTQKKYIYSAIINIVSSIMFVKVYGLVGVAIGTLIAMIYQTIWMVKYNINNFLKLPVLHLIKQFGIDFGTVFFSALLTYGIQSDCLTYTNWIVMACKVSFITILSSISFNFVFYRYNLKKMLSVIIRKGKALVK